MAARWVTGLLLVLAGWLMLAGAAEAATRNGLIAYEFASGTDPLDPDANADAGLYVMRPDGTGRRRLIAGGAFARPRFSPDGNSVLVSSGTDARPDEISVASLARDDGVRRVGDGGQAAWSPDSDRIVYAKYQPATDTTDIHVVGVGGTGDETIRRERYPCVYGEFTTGIWWSAATDRIMYVCGKTVTSIEPDGSERRAEKRLPQRRVPLFGLLTFYDVQLSYDGTRFLGTYEGTDDLSTWNWMTGAQTDATSDGSRSAEEWPAWAPDGSRLVFADTPEGPGPTAIAIAGTTGGKTRLGAGGGVYAHSSWQPCIGGVTATCDPVTLDATRVGPLTRWDAQPTLADGAAAQTGDSALTVIVGCSGRSGEICDVALTAQTVKAVAAARRHKVTVAHATARIRPGKAKKVKLTLRRQGRALLRREGRLKLRVTATARRSDGRRQTAGTSLTARAKR